MVAVRIWAESLKVELPDDALADARAPELRLGFDQYPDRKRGARL